MKKFRERMVQEGSRRDDWGKTTCPVQALSPTICLFVCLLLSRHRNLILPRMAWASAMKTVRCLPRPTEGTMATAGGFPSQSEAGTRDRV